MKKFFLYGKLGERFGREWSLNVKTVPEGIQAIDANVPGFCQYLLRQELRGINYIISTKKATQIKNEEECLTSSTITCQLDDREVHICPTIAGGAVFIPLGLKIMAKIGISAATASTIAVGTKIVAAVIGATVLVGASMLIGAIVKSLIDIPEMGDPASTKSYIMNGPSNITRQGVPVPIGYGRLIIGSTTIQSTLRSYDMGRSTNATLLESFDQIQIFDLLCEGPIEGIVNAHGEKTYDIEQGIYLNDQPIKNAPKSGDDTSESSGTYNYVTNESGTPVRVSRGMAFERLPLVDSYAKKSTAYSEQLIGPNPYESEAIRRTLEAAKASEANVISHYIEDEHTVRCFINLSVVCFEQTKNPDHPIGPNQITFGIKINDGVNYLRYDSHAYTIKYRTRTINNSTEPPEGVSSPSNQGDTFMVTINGIATSDYKFEIQIDLPPQHGGGPRVVEVVRLTPEINPYKAEDNFRSTLNSVFEEKKYQMSYPHCAIANINFDAKNMSAMPKRSYHAKLLKVPMPQNYDPVTRYYNGPWNGLFEGQRDSLDTVASIQDNRKKWTDNPAWIFYDLATNPRYGLAKYGVGISEDLIDKWSLYKAAKYCDELVLTGFAPEREWRDFTVGIHDVHSSVATIEVGVNTGSITREKDSQQGSRTDNGCSITEGEKAVTVISSSGLQVGMRVTGDGIPAGAEISKIDSNTTFSMDQAAEATDADVALDFDKLFSRVSLSRLSKRAFEKEFGSGYVFKGRKIIFRFVDDSGSYAYFEGAIRKSKYSENSIQVYSPNFRLLGIKDDDGQFKGQCVCQFSHPIVEPRFTAHLYITQFQQALGLFKNLGALFQGMVSYIDGRVGVVQESLKEPVMLFNNSNVTEQGFNYTGVDRFNRKTAVVVRYSNKYKGYKGDVAYEEDSPAIDRFGYNEASLTGVGITSPSQAQRLARFFLYVSQLETEVVVFTCGGEGAYLRAGETIELHDNNRQEKYSSGRIKKTDQANRSITLDRKIEKPTMAEYGYEFIAVNHQPNETYDSVNLKSLIGGELGISPGARALSDQNALIKNVRSTQFTRFVGGINSSDKITNLLTKKNFTIDIDSKRIASYMHGLIEGDKILLDSDGSLPEPFLMGLEYTVDKVFDHSFTIKLKDGLGNSILVTPLTTGLDELENEGGLHYFINQNKETTKGDIKNIGLGAAWSIANNMLVEPKIAVDDYLIDKGGLHSIVGADETIVNKDAPNWYSSSEFLADFHSPNNVNGWIFLNPMGWVYISDLLPLDQNNDPVVSDGFYYYHNILGWMFADKKSGSSGAHHILTNRVSALKGEAIHIIGSGVVFIYTDSLDEAVGDHYLGSGLKILKELNSPKGYYLAFDESVYDLNELDSPPSFNAGATGTSITGGVPVLEITSSQKYLHADGSGMLQLKLSGGSHSLKGGRHVKVQGYVSGGWSGDGVYYAKFLQSNQGTSGDKINSSGSTYDYYLLVGSSGTPPAGSGEIFEISQKIEEAPMFSQKFRIKAIKENEQGTYEVSASEYNPLKFAAIESNINIEKPRAYIPPQADMSIPDAPENLQLVDITYRPE